MSRRSVHAAGLLFVMGLVIASSPSCTLLNKGTTDQCNTDADCAARGPTFIGTVCSPTEKVCVPSTTFCRSNAQCVERNAGQPFFCRKSDNVCVSLTSKECNRVLAEPDAIKDDNTIFLGTMWGSIIAPPIGAERSVDLARSELFQATGTLPPAAPGKDRRPLAFVSCDCVIPGCIEPSMKHLVENVKVPAILGFTLPENLPPAAQVAFPAKTLLLTPASQPEQTLNLPGREGLLWEFTPGYDVTTPAWAEAISKVIEPLVRQRNNIPQGTPIKVLTLKQGSGGAFNSLEQGLFERLSYNGKSATDNRVDGNYESYEFGNQISDPENDALRAQAILNTVRFEPNIIVVAGGDAVNSIATEIENQWPANKPKPFWSLAVIGVGGFVGANEDLRKRVLGVYPTRGQRNDDYQIYAGTYAGRHPDVKTGESALTYLSSGAYDATFALAYAIIANGDRPVTGPNLNESLRKVFGGEVRVKNGRGGAGSAVSALSAGRTIDYQCMEPCKFDAAGRLPKGNAYLSCLKKPTNPNQWDRLLDTGIVYSGETKAYTNAGALLVPGNVCDF